MRIEPTGGTFAAGRAEHQQSVPPADKPGGDAPAGPVDRVEISDEARRLSQLADGAGRGGRGNGAAGGGSPDGSGGVGDDGERSGRTQQISLQIGQGNYETPDKLEAAARRFIEQES